MPTMRRNRVPDARQAPPGSRSSPAICAFETHAADIVWCARAHSERHGLFCLL